MPGAMRPSSDLPSLLSKWRALTEKEAAAISNNDWDDLFKQQRRKSHLQKKISSARAQPDDPLDSSLHTAVAELLVLEGRNRDALQAKRLEQQHKLDSATATLHRLNALRRAYAPGGRL